MKKITLIISLLGLCTFTFGQGYLNSKSYESFRDADSIIQKLLSLNYQNIETINYSLSGELMYQGHYSIPRKRKISPYTINVSAYIDNTYLQIDSVLYGKSVYVEIGYFTKDSSLVTNSEGKVISKGRIAKEQSNVINYSPVTLLWDLLENKSSLRHLGIDKETNCNVVTYVSFNKQISLFINQNTCLIDRAEILKYSSIQGDYLVQYFFSDYKLTKNNLNCPHKLIVKEWGETSQELTYSYSNIEERIDNNTKPHFSHKKIADDLYRISYPTMKHYSYVVDFGEYFGVVETPMSNNYMKLLENYIIKNLSNKVIKYAFLTHHHPDHAGGFAYFYKKGATIVTTDLSSKYQKELLECSHLLREENNIKQISEGKFDIIDHDATKQYSTKTTSLMAIEFPDNGHTKEFILYYFPKSKILIVGDYFYMSTKIRASKRADILEEFIKVKKMKVDKIYQTWSPVGMKEYCTIEELKESARLYQEKIKKTGSNRVDGPD